MPTAALDPQKFDMTLLADRARSGLARLSGARAGGIDRGRARISSRSARMPMTSRPNSAIHSPIFRIGTARIPRPDTTASGSIDFEVTGRVEVEREKGKPLSDFRKDRPVGGLGVGGAAPRCLEDDLKDRFARGSRGGDLGVVDRWYRACRHNLPDYSGRDPSPGEPATGIRGRAGGRSPQTRASARCPCGRRDGSRRPRQRAPSGSAPAARSPPPPAPPCARSAHPARNSRRRLSARQNRGCRQRAPAVRFLFTGQRDGCRDRTPGFPS